MPSVVREIWGDIKWVGRGFIEIAVPRVRKIIEKIVSAVAEAVAASVRPEPSDPIGARERELAEVNKQIMRLRERYHTSGALSAHERRNLEHLTAERAKLTQALEELQRIKTAEQVWKHQGEYSATQITDNTAHILQYDVGQSTDNKMCPNCARPMVLQWQRALQTAKVRDFFWGCSGWYVLRRNGERACEGKQRLSSADLQMFANLSRPEFQLSSPELTGLITAAGSADRLRRPLDEIQHEHGRGKRGTELYRCPAHGEALRLKRNHNGHGILDEYSLRCPWWLPGNAGCNYLVKLKSAAQLSAILDAECGSGVIAATGT
ncbi:MAG: hypothetical protein ACREVE_04105 [Gammaproteobacteria bacterium]